MSRQNHLAVYGHEKIPSGAYQCKVCMRARGSAWVAANREKRRMTQRSWYEANREKAIARAAAWAEANADRKREIKRKHFSANPEKAREIRHRRRARLMGALGSFTKEDVVKQLKAQRGRCFWCRVCTKKTYHVDHVIPLARGGTNGPENIVIACPRCNMRKNKKLPCEFADRFL